MPLRERFGAVYLSSPYRTEPDASCKPGYNDWVSGASLSQHMYALTPADVDGDLRRDEARPLLACRGAHGRGRAAFMTDLEKRLAGPVQLTTDGHQVYLRAVKKAFREHWIDYECCRSSTAPTRTKSGATAHGLVANWQHAGTKHQCDQLRTSRRREVFNRASEFVDDRVPREVIGQRVDQCFPQIQFASSPHTGIEPPWPLSLSAWGGWRLGRLVVCRAGSRRLLLLGGFAVAVTACSYVVSGAARAQDSPVECDPTEELCLLTEEPWIAPQVLFYEGPATADGFSGYWKQRGKEGEFERVKMLDRSSATNTWSAVLPVGPRDGELTLRAKTDTLELATSSTGVVDQLVSRFELRITKKGARHSALLTVRGKDAYRARVKLQLRGRYPAERYGAVKKWRDEKTLSRAGRTRVRVPADAKRRCKAYAKCKLKVTATVLALGYKLDRGTAARSVPTSRERPTGSLAFVPGRTKSTGGGRSYSYAVYVEKGLKVDREAFARRVGATLTDRRGWTRTGRVSFRQVPKATSANTRVILASPRLVDRLCAPLATQGYVSCTQGASLILNLNRWRSAVPHWNRSREDYRRMLVNHEMGHRIGHGHRNCAAAGNHAPVMQQQTYGLQGCKANPWPTDSEARVARGGEFPEPGLSLAGWLE